MIIYPSEQGFANKMWGKVNLSAAIKVVDRQITLADDFIDRAFSAESAKPSNDGLFYMENVLVTAGWNANDDVFDKTELYKARHSPLNKQLNLNHVDSDIIGHTINCFACDENYEPLADNLSDEDIPDFFHIKAGDVIYRIWHQDDREKQIATLIDEINNNKWSVSMECMFAGFDYALRSPNGENFILRRDASTAHATKHLRIFGGDGEFEGNRIGRLFRDISFSGKGVVESPANPYSIIFNNFSSTAKLFVYSNNDRNLSGDTFMPDIDNKAVAEEIKSLRDENKTLSVSLAKAEVATEKAAAKLEAATEDVTSLKDRNKSLASDLIASQSKHADLESKLAEATKKISDLTTANEKLNENLTRVEANVKLQDRKNRLTAALVDKQVEDAAKLASAFVDKHASQADDVFAELFDLFVQSKALTIKKLPGAKNGQVNTFQAASLLEDDSIKTDENVDVENVEDEDVATVDTDEIFEASAKEFAGWLRKASGNKNLFKNVKKEIKD